MLYSIRLKVDASVDSLQSGAFNCSVTLQVNQSDSPKTRITTDLPEGRLLTIVGMAIAISLSHTSLTKPTTELCGKHNCACVPSNLFLPRIFFDMMIFRVYKVGSAP